MKKITFCAAGLDCTILVGYWYASAQSANAIPDPRPRRFHQASNLPDLSGLVWLEGNRFLAVHDAKVEDEIGNPRVSLIELPANSKGVRWVGPNTKLPRTPEQ